LKYRLEFGDAAMLAIMMAVSVNRNCRIHLFLWCAGYPENM
jgi:hypothetical protein